MQIMPCRADKYCNYFLNISLNVSHWNTGIGWKSSNTSHSRASARAQLKVSQPHRTAMQFPLWCASSASQEPGGTHAPDILAWSSNPASASLTQKCLAIPFGNWESSFQEGSWGKLGLFLGADCIWNNMFSTAKMFSAFKAQQTGLEGRVTNIPVPDVQRVRNSRYWEGFTRANERIN